ncbi:MAG: hypothetical protein ACOC9J_03445 [Persicimonas sp.]
MGGYILNGATVLPMTAPDDVLEHAAVVVRDHKIESIHDRPVEPGELSHEYEFVDLDGRVVGEGGVGVAIGVDGSLVAASAMQRRCAEEEDERKEEKMSA